MLHKSTVNEKMFLIKNNSVYRLKRIIAMYISTKDKNVTVF